MAEELRAEILAYLESHNTVTLATCRDNLPWAATVFYASEGFRLYFFSAPDSRHCQNLAENPRVAATVQEDYRDWRKIKGIQLEGRVEEIVSPNGKQRAFDVYARKYPEAMKLFTDPESGLYHRAFLRVRFYRVLPERVFFIDNEKGFGQRRELVIAGEGGDVEPMED
jgi:uncharacterized protein YhbP (UPF0306 family)